MTTDEMLLQLIEGQKQMASEISILKEGQKQLFEGQKETNKRLDNMENDIKSIKLELENRISPALKTFCEMQLENSKRLRSLEHDMQEFKDQLVIGEVLHGIKESNLL